MKIITTINGRIVKRGQDKISVFDNALLYAEGLFETFLAIDNRVIFAQDHLTRLYNGVRVTGLEIPVLRKRLLGWMTRTAKEHPDRIKKLRLTVTAGEAARWVGVQGKPQIILSASPHQMPTRPFTLHLSDFKIDHQSTFRRIKTLSYAIHAAALKRAHDRGCDDALLLNQQNRIAEVTSANIYWVRKGLVFTPPLSAGCLEGVTRKMVLAQAHHLGLKVTERNITLEKMADADEVFISSSLKLVVGVSKIVAGRRVYRFKPGPVTSLLADRFGTLVGLS